MHGVSFRLEVLKPKYATFLSEMLAVNPLSRAGHSPIAALLLLVCIVSTPEAKVRSICKGAKGECKGGLCYETDVIMHPVYLFEWREVAYSSFKRRHFI